MRVLFSTLLLVQAVITTHQDTLCCKQATGFRQCRNACTKFVTETDVTLRFRKLKELPKDCPGHLTGLWRCLNGTNPATINQYVSSKMPNKAGPCCLLTSVSKCQRDCLDGKMKRLNASCAPMIDQLHPSLISCIHRHNVTAKCCHSASRSCVKACKLLFASEKPPKPAVIKRFKNNCAKYQHVLKCVPASMDTKKRKGSQLKCCSLARNYGCKEGCRKALLSIKSINDAMTSLIAACKGPYESAENSDMWTCFLNSKVPPSVAPTSYGTMPVAGMPRIDAAKLQCCSKGATSVCWSLCVKMFSSPWSGSQTYPQFDKECAYNPREANLMNCLDDVTKPCQLGCSGLNFCTNFNNRHTELFRSCDAKSDLYAKSHMQQWHEGIIKVPGMPILVQDIKTCLPDTWKAIACLLQIKPCSIKLHRSTICKSDCIHILQKCGNSSSYISKKSVEDICNKLSPSESNCISITKYLIPSKYTDVTDEVTHPCNPNPCQKSKICDINRMCYAESLDRCEPHTCVPGCPLGEASAFLVRVGEYARVPVESGRDGCFRVCYCGTDGKLSSCTTLNCMLKKTCAVHGEPEPRQHGAHFMLGCNSCACFAGELMCTKTKCIEPLQIPDSEPEGRPKRNHTPMFTSLPCGCSAEYQPVCASSGRTYPNPCIASCAGFKNSQVQKGSCETIDPCDKEPCKGQRCLINRRICLSPHDQCDQYICESKHCKDMQLEPACDSDGVQHPNLCAIHLKRKTHAYKGFCKPHCSQPTHSLCGVDGETYSSICAAMSSRVIIDYEGPCKTVGFGPGFGTEGRCDNVKCLPLVPSNCIGIHPPGACCPHCAAQLRILVSLTQLDINSEGLQDHHSPVTLDHLLVALRRHVTTTECDLFGYQSIEGDIVILIKAITNKPTALQIEACSLEAQKIEALINRESPSFTSHILLSTLKGAQTQTPTLSAKVQGCCRHLMSVQHLIIALIQTYVAIKWILSS